MQYLEGFTNNCFSISLLSGGIGTFIIYLHVFSEIVWFFCYIYYIKYSMYLVSFQNICIYFLDEPTVHKV